MTVGRRIPSALALTLACLVVAPWPAGQAAEAKADPASVRRGERIYREGLLSSGETIAATVAVDVPVSAAQLNCVGCHRRSGLGSSEGGTLIPPITGDLLFAPRERVGADPRSSKPTAGANRPAYTAASLAAAIRTGLDAAGRTLQPFMPRYDLRDDDLRDLVNFLESLQSSSAPGVTESTIFFATVVTDGVPENRRRAMLDFLQRFAESKNAGTREETRRAEHAPFYQDFHYPAYRRWQLRVWELNGAPTTWPEQLEREYALQPVFALLAGVGSGSWQPIHDFCEHHAVPCVYPTTDLPGRSDTNNYNLYFSEGVSLEARVLGAHLLAERQANSPRVLQIIEEGEPEAQVAGDAFAAALAAGGERSLRRTAVTTQVAEALAIAAEAEQTPLVSVIWSRQIDWQRLAQVLEAQPRIEQLYVSASMLEGAFENVPAGTLRDRLRVIYPFELPDSPRKLLRFRAWARINKVEIVDERTQGDAYFTASLVSDAITGIGGYFSREYFVEKIEHMVDRMLTSSVYPRLSLASGQRYASRGAYLVRIDSVDSHRLVPVTDWIAP